MEETRAERVDRKVLGWFGHVERMEEEQWPRRVREAEVEGDTGRGRLVFGQMDGVRRTLGKRGADVRAAMRLVNDRCA